MKTKKNNVVETWLQSPETVGPLRSSILSTSASTLHVVAGPHQGDVFQLSDERLHVGRADWCNISLHKDMHVSRHHCEFLWHKDGLQIRDHGSRNGITLEGSRVYHALVKPGQKVQVGDTVFMLQSEERTSQIHVKYHDQSGLLVGVSEKMREIFSLLRRLSHHELPVLLQGETGTGKTSVARALHQQSLRNSGPFVQVNCGSLSPSLVEAELFGYEQGAFTGANKQHRGFFEQANGGTLFLDEIAELPIELQPKLLDVLERKQVRRLGSQNEVSVDFRLVTATHQDLGEAIAEGTFREDLFYRLAVMVIPVIPLRERIEDLPLLLDFMLSQLGAGSRRFTDKSIQKLQKYLWPGNVRELRNVVERALLFADGNLLLPEDIQLPSTTSLSMSSSNATQRQGAYPLVLQRGDGDFRPMDDILSEAEKAVLEQSLTHYNWDVGNLREKLQISKSWFYKLLKKYDIRRP